jgi:hypothetical protein
MTLFYAITNVKIATAAIVARDSGIQIHQWIRHIDAPSTSALSSSSRGIASNAGTTGAPPPCRGRYPSDRSC